MGDNTNKLTEKDEKALIKSVIDSIDKVQTDDLMVEYIINSVGCNKETATILLAMIMHKKHNCAGNRYKCTIF